MGTQLEPTGERMIEGAYFANREAYLIYIMHSSSYLFAEQYCQGKRVLDLGCGSGYGVNKLSSTAKSIIGVDISNDAICFAREAYQGENIEFETISPDERLPFSENSFDVILSFQVIEHVANTIHYLKEADRVLSPGGTVIIITPDRKHRLFPKQRPWNRWHLREYSPEALKNEVEAVFEVIKMLRMGARDEIASIETRRYLWTKLATLPFTLPGTPEFIRRIALNTLHKLMPKRKSVFARDTTSIPKFDFDERDIEISENPKNSLNIVALARKKER